MTRQLDGTTPLWIAARALLKERANDFSRRLEDVLHDFDVEAIHDLRVSSRRMREGLALFACCYSAGAIDRLIKRIRRITRLLGAIRNRDEALLFFAALRDQLDSSCRSEVDRLLTAFRDERDKEVKHLRTGLVKLSATSLPDRYRRLVNFPCLFTAPAGSVDLFAPLAGFARETLSSRLGEVLQLVPAARMEEDFAAQHRLRITVKHFRYRMEMLSFLLGSSYKELSTAVKGYQEVLGRMHDLDVFAAVSREAGFAEPTTTAVLEAIAEQRSRLFTDFTAMLAAMPFETIGKELRSRL